MNCPICNYQLEVTNTTFEHCICKACRQFESRRVQNAYEIMLGAKFYRFSNHSSMDYIRLLYEEEIALIRGESADFPDFFEELRLGILK